MNKIRWGIVAPGRIAHKAAKALQELSKSDKEIILQAVASRNAERAKDFALEYGFKSAYGSYEELFLDSEVDAVYIASPHSFHAELSLKALQNGKHVVCEKPAAVNCRQLNAVIAEARKRNLFFMEATWMCFNPTILTVLSWIYEGRIGSVENIEAAFSFRNRPNKEDRLFSPELAGGALLDTGIYPVTFALMAAGKKGALAQPVKINSSAKLLDGIDAWNSVLLSFPGDIAARLESSVTTESASNSKDAYVYGTKGFIKIPLFWMAQEAFLYEYGENSAELSDTCKKPFEINGYEYEFKEAVTCIREGRTESSLHTQDDSLEVCKVLDKCREQWHLTYPGENDGLNLEKKEEKKNMDVTIYTDGGCHGNPGPGGWGAVLLYDGKQIQLSGGEKNTTNNRMELTAAIKALEAVADSPTLCTREVSVYSDSQYVKNGITSWISSWKKNGWKTAAKKPVLNQDLWQALDELNASLTVKWNWVKGHAGVTYNEVCDELCQKEIAAFE